jgi:Flp pilus assembly pilin Flp
MSPAASAGAPWGWEPSTTTARNVLAHSQESPPALRESRTTTMPSLLPRLWLDDRAQDMAEYAIMLGVIGAIVLTAFTLLGANISTAIANLAAKVLGS